MRTPAPTSVGDVRISPTQAHAGRRAAFAAGALCATLLAHVIAGHGVDVLPIAPALWLGVVSGAALAGPPRSTFTRLGAVPVVAGAFALQALLHGAMWAAPWAFGLTVAHMAPLDPRALAAHAVVGVMTAVLLLAGEHLLEALSAVVRRLARALRPRRRRAGGHGVRVPGSAGAPAQDACRRPSARGPPPIAVT